MNKNPTISVLMPALNAEKYIAEAIESILSQTYSDFEFIIINDGSTDKTEEIIKSYQDPRIIYIKNENNLGLSKSFNIGIEKARGRYIARMDADDISIPKRFKRQLAFLNKRPHVDIVGSSMRLIDEHGNERGVYRRQLDQANIKFSSLFSTPMMHPTIMGRVETFKNHHYNENLSNSEDYELWSRLLFETDVHFANIHEPLLLYRTYPHSFTQTLNIDKRTFSAHNTIKNIEHYITLSSTEKETIVQLRQEKKLPLNRLFLVFGIYLKAAVAFSNKEHLTFKKSLKIYGRLVPLIVFLLKHKIKHG